MWNRINCESEAITTTLVTVLSTGELVIGHDSPISVVDLTPKFQVWGEGAPAVIAMGTFRADEFGGDIILFKSRSATVGGSGAALKDDDVGLIRFVVDDGNDYKSEVSRIEAEIDGVLGVDDTPGRLSFWTTPTGSGVVIERWRIDSKGNLLALAGAGDLDLQSNGQLLNSYGPVATKFTRTATNGSIAHENLILKTETNTNMVDGFGGVITFNIRDSAAVDNRLGWLGFERNGADDTGRFFISVDSNGTPNKGFMVDASGELYGDLDGTSGNYFTNGVNLFDEYDDAIELQRFTHTQPAPWISDEQILANRQRMEELGVIVKADSPSGYMVRRTAMDRLLAGGIYQTRFSLDALRLEHAERIGNLESQVAAL